MREVLIALFVVLTAARAAGAQEKTPPSGSSLPPAGPAAVFRTGGETFADAVPIPALPFSDTGTTCGHLNDMDEVCPFDGSTSPDVVYRLTDPLGHVGLLDLCASSYDTKLYVYRASDLETPVACNDDAQCGYSGWQSRVECCFTEGETYYIVIDGYGGACGNYVLNIACLSLRCTVPCPPDAAQENEPPCADGYVDHFNGGCLLGDPAAVSPLPEQAQGCATVCGRACSYTTNGQIHQDLDMYEIMAAGGDLELGVTAEYYVQGWVFTGECGALQEIEVLFGGPCVEETVQWTGAPGQRFFVGVAPGYFGCTPESGYVLRVCGLQPNPTSSAPSDPPPLPPPTWGRIKATYAR